MLPDIVSVDKVMSSEIDMNVEQYIDLYVIVC